ncbi:MAG TPA: TonB-dependent receptor, partial [Candidatus Omnitrophota bacterium]|nr:TonB-dependent receptor [Candidatus Omnitrophota bacterium]
VRAAFTQFGGNLEAGWTPRDTLLALGYEYNKTEDALFAGASMDAPLDETDTLRLKFEKRNLDAGALTALRANAYGTMLDHVMDNFSLRAAPASRMIVESESDTYGGQAAADFKAGGSTVTLGLDVQVNNRDARRYQKTGSAVGIIDPSNLESVTWPDVTIGQYGVFGEGTLPVAADSRVKLGARYDRVEVDYGAADLGTSKNTGTYRTANQLYAGYYGTPAGDREENNVGGLARYEHDIGASTLFAGVSRSVRTADTTERGIAHKAMGTNKAWVGNPNIDPEAHHQLDLGVSTASKSWTAGASAFYDRVKDFILRDTARGQAGIMKTDQATIYRNVDAMLTGFELDGSYRFAGNWKVAADAAYTYAENLDENSPIAQIAPLNGKVSLAYAPEGWTLGTRMRWAATQTRVDNFTGSGSGQDAAKTPGHAVFDLFGSYTLVDGVAVDAGITNLFDHAYAEHLNRSASFDNTVTQVYEPGRSFYLRARAEF